MVKEEKENKKKEYKENSELIEDLRNFTTNSYISSQIFLAVMTFLSIVGLVIPTLSNEGDSGNAALIIIVGLIIIFIAYKVIHDLLYWQYLRNMVFVIITEDVEEIKEKVK